MFEFVESLQKLPLSIKRSTPRALKLVVIETIVIYVFNGFWNVSKCQIWKIINIE